VVVRSCGCSLEKRRGKLSAKPEGSGVGGGTLIRRVPIGCYRKHPTVPFVARAVQSRKLVRRGRKQEMVQISFTPPARQSSVL
jgi:hypothetical protein